MVLAKSPNENLNYALPIGMVIDAGNQATFDQRFLTKLTFMQESKIYALKDAFPLPLSWGSFEQKYQQVIQQHADEARANC